MIVMKVIKWNSTIKGLIKQRILHVGLCSIIKTTIIMYNFL